MTSKKVPEHPLLDHIIENLKTKEDRLLSLLRDPEDPMPWQWYMYVPSCFSLALDIRLTPRVPIPVRLKKNKEKQKPRNVWTQGSLFAFGVGDTFYDTIDGYLEWSAALKKIRLCIQIKGSKPCELALDGQAPRYPGFVSFDILTPNDRRTRLSCRSRHVMTQDDFVRFLLVGPWAILKGKITKAVNATRKRQSPSKGKPVKKTSSHTKKRG